MLTKTQKQHFEVFGFLILRQLFTADEIELICCESDSILTANREGKPFPGTQRQAMIPFFEKSPALLKFIADDRIHGIAEDLMGPDYIYTGSEGNLHVGDTQWHGKDPDVAVLPEVKIAFYSNPQPETRVPCVSFPAPIDRDSVNACTRCKNFTTPRKPCPSACKVMKYPAWFSNRSPVMLVSSPSTPGTPPSAEHLVDPSTPLIFAPIRKPKNSSLASSNHANDTLLPFIHPRN